MLLHMKMVEYIYMYVYTYLIFSLSIHPLMDIKFFPYLGYCEYCCNKHGNAVSLRYTDFTTKLKDSLWNWRKYLQTIYLIKG